MKGPEVALDPKAFATLALVVHEMMTNSAKYGALANSVGRVEIIWNIDDQSGLVIDWKESGGPPVQPPSRRGSVPPSSSASIPFDLKATQRSILTCSAFRLALSSRPTLSSRCRLWRTRPSRSTKKAGGAPSLRHGFDRRGNLIIVMSGEVILLELGAHHVNTAA